jgi:glucosamine-phosphate N-acetyltransferase
MPPPTTPNANTPVFSPSLIPSPSSLSHPSEHYTLRPLQRGDCSRGYFDCLSTLTWVGDRTATTAEQSFDEDARFRQSFEERFDWMLEKGEGWFYNVVIEFESRIVGTGVCIVERKL